MKPTKTQIRAMFMDIVKIQISDSAGEAMMLIYNENENFLTEYKPTKAELRSLGYKKGLFKQYWLAKLPKRKGKIELIKRICSNNFSPNF